jgi:hypothetical protein
MVTLPRGCEINGRREVDVGMCNPKICRGPDDIDNGECIDEVNFYCCGALNYETVFAQCSNASVYAIINSNQRLFFDESVLLKVILNLKKKTTLHDCIVYLYNYLYITCI